ncbi:hypothetical protein GGR56DRAFT_678868 [Xylariaceae sp. FL0804]|nr:hypothetical protein GGR56DRAFT_678868 [Xylariaceae sp. FL0804]
MLQPRESDGRVATESETSRTDIGESTYSADNNDSHDDSDGASNSSSDNDSKNDASSRGETAAITAHPPSWFSRRFRPSSSTTMRQGLFILFGVITLATLVQAHTEHGPRGKTLNDGAIPLDHPVITALPQLLAGYAALLQLPAIAPVATEQQQQVDEPGDETPWNDIALRDLEDRVCVKGALGDLMLSAFDLARESPRQGQTPPSPRALSALEADIAANVAAFCHSPALQRSINSLSAGSVRNALRLTGFQDLRRRLLDAQEMLRAWAVQDFRTAAATVTAPGQKPQMPRHMSPTRARALLAHLAGGIFDPKQPLGGAAPERELARARDAVATALDLFETRIEAPLQAMLVSGEISSAAWASTHAAHTSTENDVSMPVSWGSGSVARVRKQLLWAAEAARAARRIVDELDRAQRRYAVLEAERRAVGVALQLEADGKGFYTYYGTHGRWPDGHPGKFDFELELGGRDEEADVEIHNANSHEKKNRDEHEPRGTGPAGWNEAKFREKSGYRNDFGLTFEFQGDRVKVRAASNDRDREEDRVRFEIEFLRGRDDNELDINYQLVLPRAGALATSLKRQTDELVAAAQNVGKAESAWRRPSREEAPLEPWEEWEELDWENLEKADIWIIPLTVAVYGTMLIALLYCVPRIF